MSADAFHWSERASGETDSTPRGELPSSGPIYEFWRRATVISEPPDATRPWVLAAGGRVIKVYDLQAFKEMGRYRVREEAELAKRVSEVDGVVTTYEAGEVGRWFVIEMERLGPTLDQVVAEIQAGERPPIPPELLGRMFEEAAIALSRVHARHVIHHDVKLANLMLDRSSRHLMVADFSISARRARRSSKGGEGDRRGTYAAPEQEHGQVGYGVDQYALAIAARQALSDQATGESRQVLSRGAAHDPADRFATTREFGESLRMALDDSVPRRLSTRMQNVKPQWRLTWAPTIATVAVVYALIIWARTEETGVGDVIIILALVAVIVCPVSRICARFRGGRTQPRLRWADRGWFTAALFVVAGFGFVPLLRYNPGDSLQYIPYYVIGVFLLTAFLGSVPRDAGADFISVVRRWEDWRTRGNHPRFRRWGGIASLMLASLALAALPVAVARQWPNRQSAATRSTYPIIAFTAAIRTAMLDNDLAKVCQSYAGPHTAGVAPCRTWAALAASWLRDDVANHRGIAFDGLDLKEIMVDEPAETVPLDAPTWVMRTTGLETAFIGWVERLDQSGRIWQITVSRDVDTRDPEKIGTAVWSYEIVRRDGRIAFTGVKVCDVRLDDPCVRVSQVKTEDVSRLTRRGVPTVD